MLGPSSGCKVTVRTTTRYILHLVYISYLALVLYPKIGSSSIDWPQLSRFYLKTETESILRNVILNTNRTMDNVQKRNNYTGYILLV
jgi:hypothetical protein